MLQGVCTQLIHHPPFHKMHDQQRLYLIAAVIWLHLNINDRLDQTRAQCPFGIKMHFYSTISSYFVQEVLVIPAIGMASGRADVPVKNVVSVQIRLTFMRVIR